MDKLLKKLKKEMKLTLKACEEKFAERKLNEFCDVRIYLQDNYISIKNRDLECILNYSENLNIEFSDNTNYEQSIKEFIMKLKEIRKEVKNKASELNTNKKEQIKKTIERLEKELGEL